MNECCKKPENLEEQATTRVEYPDGSDAGTLIIRKCKVCERKHYEHQVKPMEIGIIQK